MTLSWGRRYLMCPPEHFGVLYEINPWMRREVAVDLDRARTEWDGLVAALRDAGAEIETIDPVDGLPDLVFTANAGLVDGDRFLPSRFRNPERQGETPHALEWFRSRGYHIHELPPQVSHEGAGDALPFGDGLVGGYRWRSDARAHAAVSDLIGLPVRVVELVDPRLYHVDLTFCPLDDRHAIVVPEAWDKYGWRVVTELVPEPLVLTLDEALTFCANSIVVNDRIVMPCCPPRVGRQLEAWGYAVAECGVDEFLKAGGGCRCLTLALDVELAPRTWP